MKVKSPIVTLLVGVLIAAVVLILSLRAHSASQPSGAAVAAVVLS